MYINTLDEGFNSKGLQFADDTKQTQRVDLDCEIWDLKEDPYVLYRGSKIWQMPFNKNKCNNYSKIY